MSEKVVIDKPTDLQRELIATRKKLLEVNEELLQIDDGTKEVTDDEAKNIKTEADTLKKRLAVAQQRVWRQEVFTEAAKKSKQILGMIESADSKNTADRVDVLVQTKYVYDNENTPNGDDMSSILLKALIEDCTVKMRRIIDHYDENTGISMPDEDYGNNVFYSEENPDYKYYCIADIVDPVDALSIDYAFNRTKKHFGKDLIPEYNVCSDLDIHNDATYRLLDPVARMDKFNQNFGSPRRVSLLVSESRILHELVAARIDIKLKGKLRPLREMTDVYLRYMSNNMIYSLLSHAELLLRYCYYGKADDSDIIKDDGVFAPLYAVLSPPKIKEDPTELVTQIKYAKPLRDTLNPFTTLFTRSEGSGSFALGIPLDTLPVYFNLDDIAHKITSINHKESIMPQPDVYPIYTTPYAQMAMEVGRQLDQVIIQRTKPGKTPVLLEIKNCLVKVAPYKSKVLDLTRPQYTLKMFLFDNVHHYVESIKKLDGVDRKWSMFLREDIEKSTRRRMALRVHIDDQLDYAAQYATVDSPDPIMQPGSTDVEVTKEFFMNADLSVLMLYDDKEPGYLGSIPIIPLRTLKLKYNTVVNPPKPKPKKGGSKTKKVSMQIEEEEEEQQQEEEYANENQQEEEFQDDMALGDAEIDDNQPTFDDMIVDEGDEFGNIEVPDETPQQLTGQKRDREEDETEEERDAKRRKFVTSRIGAYKKLNANRQKSKSHDMERINSLTAKLDL